MIINGNNLPRPFGVIQSGAVLFRPNILPTQSIHLSVTIMPLISYTIVHVLGLQCSVIILYYTYLLEIYQY